MYLKKKTSEKLIEKNLREKVKKLGGWAIKLYCFSFTGLPDRIVLMPGGRLWFVETKSTGESPSPVQQIIIGKLRKLGFSVHVIVDKTTLETFLKEIAA